MKSLKYVVLAFAVVALVLISGCAASKKSQEIGKKEPQEVKESTAAAEREDFGCFYSCDFFPEGSPKQMCEDWNAGKQVYWPEDCAVMQYEPCIRLCESKKNGTVKTEPPIPKDMPSFEDFSKSPADFLFHTRKPFCVEQDGEYKTQIIYARPSDAQDRYDAIAPELITWIAQGNGLVNHEAEKFGMTADIKIACAGGEISVLNIKLPKSASEYNTHDGKSTPAIAASLKELGYKNSKTKYIVYYDGNTDGCEGGKAKCSGQASPKAQDDRLSEDNMYNSGPDYSLLYDVGLAELPQRFHTSLDMLAPIVMLHEYSHTLGAVQSSAPHSTKDEEEGAGHCNDEYPQEQGGNDVMCKSDKEGSVFTDSCKDTGYVFHFDCNNDDYFNPKPEPGSYLATHWNLGSPLNRYFKFG